jgi:hypothetical protein
MWHQGLNGTLNAISLSTSSDGVSWTLVGATNIPETAPGVGPTHPAVVYDANGFGNAGGPFYKIWYWSGADHATIAAIRYAESLDGVTWANFQTVSQNLGSPLVTGVAGFFYHLYGPGSVIYNPTATSIPGRPFTFPYLMTFDTATENPSLETTSIQQVGIAYSADGITNWIRYSTIPRLIGTEPESTSVSTWDGEHMFRMTITQDATGTYHGFYSGSNQNINEGLVYAHGIGHAVSRDGVTWARDWSNPIFYFNNGVAWRQGRTYAPSVLYGRFGGNQPMFKMWFSGGSDANAGQNGGIGAAVAPA